MGYGTTRSLERVAAAMGALEAAPIVFEAAQDIPQGGVLLALPALLAVGLLRHSAEQYQLPNGFYGLSSVFVLLALMALARIDSLEQLRYAAAGEWGNLLGLDRAPEVRTLRAKVRMLCGEPGRAARWNAVLAQQWIGQHAIEQSSGLAFYIDGHVRVYHGDLTKLPRHYVPRERFYLRATVDYWVNALDGQPFCYFNQAVDHGLVQAMRGDVLPWLEANVTVSAEHQSSTHGRRPTSAALHGDLRPGGLQPGVVPGVTAAADRGADLPSLSGRGGLASGRGLGAGREVGERGDGADAIGGAGNACRQAAGAVGAGGAQAGQRRPPGFDCEHEFLGGGGSAGGGLAGALVAGKLLQIYAGTLWFRRPGAIRDRRDSCYRDRAQPGVARPQSPGPSAAEGMQEPAETAAEHGDHATPIGSRGRPLPAASRRTTGTP